MHINSLHYSAYVHQRLAVAVALLQAGGHPWTPISMLCSRPVSQQ